MTEASEAVLFALVAIALIIAVIALANEQSGSGNTQVLVPAVTSSGVNTLSWNSSNSFAATTSLLKANTNYYMQYPVNLRQGSTYTLLASIGNNAALYFTDPRFTIVGDTNIAGRENVNSRTYAIQLLPVSDTVLVTIPPTETPVMTHSLAYLAKPETNYTLGGGNMQSWLNDQGSSYALTPQGGSVPFQASPPGFVFPGVTIYAQATGVPLSTIFDASKFGTIFMVVNRKDGSPIVPLLFDGTEDISVAMGPTTTTYNMDGTTAVFPAAVPPTKQSVLALRVGTLTSTMYLNNALIGDQVAANPASIAQTGTLQIGQGLNSGSVSAVFFANVDLTPFQIYNIMAMLSNQFSVTP